MNISSIPSAGAGGAPSGAAGGSLSGTYPNPAVASVGGVAAATVATVVGTAVVTSGTYSNPAWLTALATSKLSGSNSGLLGSLVGANFNVTTDQAIPITATSYVIRKIIVTNTSASLTLAAGGIYTATSKTGAIVGAGQVYSALTGASKFLDLTLAGAGLTDVLTGANIYLSLTTALGSAATADIYIFGDRIV